MNKWNPLSHNPEILTLQQLESIYDCAGDIITNLDADAINELFSGNEKDIDSMFANILEITKDTLFFDRGPLKTSSVNYLDKLTKGLDDELKRMSFNYFVTSTMPEFDFSYHHIEWGNLIQLYPWLGVIAARDHSKSYTFSFAYPLWRMYSYRREDLSRRNKLSKKGMIITNEFSLAKEFIKIITEAITDNPVLKERLYSQGGAGLGKEELICKNGAELLGKGSGSALRGRHPGWIVVDDYLDDSCLYSKTQRDQFTTFFHSVIMNMLLPKGQIIVAGTPYHQDDLYSNLKKTKGWRVFEYPAINPDGSVLWPGRYSLDKLLAKKESQGSINFSREILVKPITSDSSIFPYSILEKSFRGMDNISLTPNISSCHKKFKKVSTGLDFAISSNVGADWSVFTTIGVDELDEYWLLDQWKGKGISYNEQIAQLRRIKNSFRPDIIIGENNAFQQVMLDIAKDAGIHITPHTTGVNKYDLKSGLPALSVLFEQGRIHFPRGDAHSKEVTDSICMQAASMTFNPDTGKLEGTGEHDDELMSLWISIRGCNHVTKSFNFGFI